MRLSSPVMEHSIYEFPWIFRRVHMERPEEIPAEVEFLKKVWRRHLGRPVRRVLDIACGDSPHGRLLLEAGIAVAGIDRSPTMLRAGRLWARRDPRIKFYRRQIERFKLSERPFDAAIFMSETFPVIVANSALMSHLKSVARVMRRGALYCIDIDRQDGTRMVRGRRRWRRREVRIGPLKVEVREFFLPFSWDAPMHSIYELKCRIPFSGGAVVTRDIIPTRYTQPATLELLARASGSFELAACYADLSLTRPLGRCERRWLAVLRRI